MAWDMIVLPPVPQRATARGLRPKSVEDCRPPGALGPSPGGPRGARGAGGASSGILGSCPNNSLQDTMEHRKKPRNMFVHTVFFSISFTAPETSPPFSQSGDGKACPPQEGRAYQGSR